MLIAPITDAAPDCGGTITEVEFGPISRSTLALYAGASGDHNPVHIDLDFARRAGLPDVFAHGMLSFGVLTRVVTAWSGQGRLRSFGARFLTITQLNDLITCRGEIVEQFRAEEENRLRVKVTATTEDGRETLVGEAVVAAT